MDEVKALLRKLSIDDLRAWAGSKIFNRGKSYINKVDVLSRTDDGALAAWVSGSDEYATTVGIDPDGELEFYCTCPYDDGPCKHAVAVVLAAADYVKRNKNIPLLAEDDDLYRELFDDTDGINYEDDDWQEEDEEPGLIREPTPGEKKRKTKVVSILETMNKDELIALVGDLTRRFPEIERGILEKEQLATGKVGKLVISLRREIMALTAEPAWYNPWKGEGSLPDYSHVQEQLQALLAKGHADAVLQLGEELWTLGNEQVGQSHDEGETGTAIAQCMEVVFRALPRTSLTPPDQLLWLIDRELEDEYSLLGSTDHVLGLRTYNQSHWGKVAEALEGRLNTMAKPTSGGFSVTYRRGQVMGMLLHAFQRSGQKERVIPLLEKEADVSQCYERLVDALCATREQEKARKWCIVGFQRTAESASGIAVSLRNRLREMADKEKNHALVATYRAEEFFDNPSLAAYGELRKAGEKAGVWQQVREGMLSYLRTGRRPGRGGAAEAWPLPEPEVRRPADKPARQFKEFPDLDMLIRIAIQETRFDGVVSLYGELRNGKRYHFETDKAVADAVTGTHPQVSLDIWRFVVDGLIAQVKPKAYEEASVFLRRMCKVYYDNNRSAEWDGLLSELRREHKPKRRLMEVLDSLSGKKLLD